MAYKTTDLGSREKSKEDKYQNIYIHVYSCCRKPKAEKILKEIRGGNHI